MLFVEFPAFTRVIVTLPDDDYAHFQYDLAAHPERGNVLRGTGGFRKTRMGFPSLSVGKSGGARVIYFYLPELTLILLVALYANSRKTDLTKSEENALREIAAEIRRNFHAGKSRTV